MLEAVGDVRELITVTYPRCSPVVTYGDGYAAPESKAEGSLYCEVTEMLSRVVEVCDLRGVAAFLGVAPSDRLPFNLSMCLYRSCLLFLSSRKVFAPGGGSSLMLVV